MKLKDVFFLNADSFSFKRRLCVCVCLGWRMGWRGGEEGDANLMMQTNCWSDNQMDPI